MPTEKKKREPKDPAAIFAAALKLSLEKRADLCKQLKASVAAEVGDLDAKAKSGSELIKGL